MSQLIYIRIENFRGIALFEATPNGNSVTLKGRNSSGKSSAIDAIWWAMGGKLDGEVVRNGEDMAEAHVVFGGYRITRKQKAGGKPTLVVKSADGKTTHNSPTTLLAGFVGAIERTTFSHRKPAEQAAILRQIAPGLDTSSLDAEYAEWYEERTNVNREAKQLAAQVAGIVIPEAPESVPDDEDLVAIVSKKTDAERLRASNNQLVTAAKNAESALRIAEDNRRMKLEAFELAKAQLDKAEKSLAEADKAAKDALLKTKSLKEIDTSEIDAELAHARETNRQRTAQRQKMREAKMAREQRDKLQAETAAKEQRSAELTKRLEEIEQAKADKLAAAKLPIPGLAIKGDAVFLAQDGAGLVEISALNTATRIKLDVAIAAASGHKLVAVRDASLLDDPGELLSFAREKGIQLISEIVAKGEPLSAEIVEE